jgi:hypothetical protein
MSMCRRIEEAESYSSHVTGQLTQRLPDKSLGDILDCLAHNVVPAADGEREAMTSEGRVRGMEDNVGRRVVCSIIHCLASERTCC